jgi:hypothetical protein
MSGEKQMPSENGLIYPNMRAVNPQTGRPFRIGIIAESQTGKLWGLTSRHAFPGTEAVDIMSEHGEVIGRFSADETFDYATSTDINEHIARIEFRSDIDPRDELDFSRYWPNSIARQNDLLGAEVCDVDHPLIAAGSVTEIERTVALRRGPSKDKASVGGAYVVDLDLDYTLPDGAAGCLFMSAYGDAIGIAVARITEEARKMVLLAPIAKIFANSELHLKVPPFFHWSDVETKVRLFKGLAKGSQSLDLGPRPRTRGASS